MPSQVICIVIYNLHALTLHHVLVQVDMFHTGHELKLEGLCISWSFLSKTINFVLASPQSPLEMSYPYSFKRKFGGGEALPIQELEKALDGSQEEPSLEKMGAEA